MRAISNDRGIVVVTGPTGSGKTNTLNCILAILEEDDDLVIIELGAPIEIESAFSSSNDDAGNAVRGAKRDYSPKVFYGRDEKRPGRYLLHRNP